MKVQVDGKDLFELSETQKKIIMNDISADAFEEDMKRRLHWALDHKMQNCLERLKKDWMPVLAQRYASIPTDPEAFAELVFSQPDYKCRQTRDVEAAAALEKGKKKSAK